MRHVSLFILSTCMKIMFHCMIFIFVWRSCHASQMFEQKTSANDIQMKTKKNLKRHYNIQVIFTKSFNQTNSLVKISRKFFEMKFSFFHDIMKILKKHWCNHLLNIRITFLDSQMNDVVYMFQKIFDLISLSSNMKENDEFMKNLQMKLRVLSIHEDIIINAMNLKKISLMLLYFSDLIAFNS